MKLKAAANVKGDMGEGEMGEVIAMGIAPGILEYIWGILDVDLKVYVKPYSVFTGGKFVFKLLYQLYYNFIKRHTYRFRHPC